MIANIAVEDPPIPVGDRLEGTSVTDLSLNEGVMSPLPPPTEAFGEDARAAAFADLHGSARAASEFLKALANENRLLLLCLVSERERSVGELEEILGLRQSAVSQQLARLRLDGFVKTRREGKSIFYSLADEDTRRVIEVVHSIFCAPDRAASRRNGSGHRR